MTYQIIYSSHSTMPMQSDDLEALLQRARFDNETHGISGALVYAERVFLQILEGPRETLQTLMAKIAKDVRHEKVTVLQESEIPHARFEQWNMAYVSATDEQVARWAGIDIAAGGEAPSEDHGEEFDRTAQFARDILALLASEKPAAGRPS